MTHPERDESKLPKWAQGELRRMRQDIKYLQGKLSAGPEDSVVFANPYSDEATPLGDADIEFRVGEEKFKVGIKESNHGPYLEVYATGSVISVVPQSSNVLRVRSGIIY